MNIFKIIYILLIVMVLPSKYSFAYSKDICQQKIIDKGTIEGIYIGTMCGDSCYAAFKINEEEEIGMFADPEKVERQLKNEGNYVEVKYNVEQFWNEFAEECVRSKVYIDGKVINKNTINNTSEFNMCIGEGDGCYMQCKETTTMNFITIKSDGTGAMDGYRASDFPFTWESIRGKFMIFHYDGYDEEYIMETTKEHGTLLIGKTECLKKIR